MKPQEQIKRPPAEPDVSKPATPTDQARELAAQLRTLADAHGEMASAFADAAEQVGGREADHYIDLADAHDDAANRIRQQAEQMEGEPYE